MEQDERKELVSIPLVCKENSDARFIKIIKWLVILLIVSNICWAVACELYLYIPQGKEIVETTDTITQDTEGEGINNFVGNDGDIVNGKTDNNSNGEEN